MKPLRNLTDTEWAELVQHAAALPDAPPLMVQAAIDLWDHHAPAKTTSSAAAAVVAVTATGGFQGWIASLGFDSWAHPPVAMGMRSLRSEVRQLLFTSAAADVDLRIEPQTENLYTLAGQVLSAKAQGQVDLFAQGSANAALGMRRIELDDSSEFRIESVQAGTYRLTVHLQDHRIELPSIEIGPFGGTGQP